jgi:hypothetical protein
MLFIKKVLNKHTITLDIVMTFYRQITCQLSLLLPILPDTLSPWPSLNVISENKKKKKLKFSLNASSTTNFNTFNLSFAKGVYMYPCPKTFCRGIYSCLCILLCVVIVVIFLNKKKIKNFYFILFRKKKSKLFHLKNCPKPCSAFWELILVSLDIKKETKEENHSFETCQTYCWRTTQHKTSSALILNDN